MSYFTDLPFQVYYSYHNDIDFFIGQNSDPIFREFQNTLLCTNNINEQQLLDYCNNALRYAVLLSNIKYPKLNCDFVDQHNWIECVLVATLLKRQSSLDERPEMEYCAEHILQILRDSINCDQNPEPLFSMCYNIMNTLPAGIYSFADCVSPGAEPNWNYLDGQHFSFYVRITNDFDYKTIIDLIDLLCYKEDKLRLLDKICYAKKENDALQF